MWHIEIPPTSPDRGIGGSLVVVDRLLAGVAISVVRFARESFPCGGNTVRREVPLESALLGPDRK
ncbi:hypothetical protein [Marinobacter alexandrii]|uniref:hypothetical protein n=1 Tax=Marinobacter alexandrii TaxID=2570351 RepID=UPI003297E8F2